MTDASSCDKKVLQSSLSSIEDLLINFVDDSVDNELVILNGHNVKLSNAPVRIMFYHKNCWVDFRDEVAESLRSGFLERKPVLPLEIEGAKYAIDFVRMVQVDLGSGNQWSIAWFDERGKAFFPARFLDRALSHHEVMVFKGKRKIQNDDDLGSKRHTSNFPNAKILSKSDKTYMFTSHLFVSRMFEVDPNVVVTNIHEFEISSPLARSRWEVVEKQVEITEARRGEANVVYAWYAARKETVTCILSHGFKVPEKTFSLPQSVRAGIFLASLEFPHHSATQCSIEKDDEKHLILCRVVLGSVEKVELEYNQTGPSREDFDTGSDDPSNPKWYVVWNNDVNKRIIPVCVVSCNASVIMPVEWNLPNYEFDMIPKLVLEVKKQLPISRVRILDIMYDCFKKQNMAGDVFMRQLRNIFGEDIFMKGVKAFLRPGID